MARTERISARMVLFLERSTLPIGAAELARLTGFQRTTARNYMERAVDYGWAVRIDAGGGDVRYQAIPHRWQSGYRRQAVPRTKPRGPASVWDYAARQ